MKTKPLLDSVMQICLCYFNLFEVIAKMLFIVYRKLVKTYLPKAEKGDKSDKKKDEEYVLAVINIDWLLNIYPVSTCMLIYLFDV